MSKEEAIKDAEAFVRRAVSRVSNKHVSDDEIRAAAKKVSKIVPQKTREAEAA